MKKIKVVVGLMVALSLIFHPTYSFAISTDTPSTSAEKFFYLTQSTVSVGDKAELNIDLDKVTYDKFTLEIQSSDSLDSVIGDNITNQEIKKDNNELVMEIDKSTSRVNIIRLQYNVPAEKKVGDKIQFCATIVKKSTEDESSNEEIVDETQSVTVELSIVEKDNSNSDKDIDTDKDIDKNTDKDSDKDGGSKDNKPDGNSGNNLPNNDGNKQPSQNKNNQDTGDQNKGNVGASQGNSKGNQRVNMGSNNGIMPSQSSMQKIGSAVEPKVVYNGSNNNYLKKLVVKGYDLNTNFSKERLTYFIYIDNDVTKLNITAECEAESAKVCIYGDKNLSSGTNKILLTVTAENGDVRTYRIYVTTEA